MRGSGVENIARFANVQDVVAREMELIRRGHEQVGLVPGELLQCAEEMRKVRFAAFPKQDLDVLRG